jgi:hypothetical protein
MINKISTNNKLRFKNKKLAKLFLLLFTRELVKNSYQPTLQDLNEILRRKEEKLNLQTPKTNFPIKQPIEKKSVEIKKNHPKLPFLFSKKRPVTNDLQGKTLTIPTQRFSKETDYIKPKQIVYQQQKPQLNLGKLDHLIKDNSIKTIECNGENSKIIVTIQGTKKTTNTILTKEEIQEIIKKISYFSRVPVSEGLFKVTIGNLIFSAIISEIVGSKFIIKKM